MYFEHNLDSNLSLLPSEYSDEIAKIITEIKDKTERQKLGQFFTPLKTTQEFTDFFKLEFNNNTVNICEPACGLGILSCCFIEQLCSYKSIKSIELTCFEIDSSIIKYTYSILNKLKSYCSNFGVSLNFNIIEEDFILYFKNIFESKEDANLFDIIISNPPFYKLENNDIRVKLASDILYGLPNIFSIFYFLSSKLIKKDGYLNFLIPRSFCSGSFFKQYREHFVNHIKFEKIHLFSSDDKIFDSHSVLYEFIFLLSVKTKVTNEYIINISHSDSVNSPQNVSFNYSFNISENIIPLPTNEDDLTILKKFNSFPLSLRSLGFTVKYSKLIITKVEKMLSDIFKDNTYPVVWLYNIESTKFEFPLQSKYHNYINYSPEIEQYLIPNRNYIFFRRYNNDDYIRRIKAATYNKDFLKADKLAIDRLVGVIFNDSENFPIETYYGLTAYLNSDTVNNYFRMINGIINVTGEMILDLPLPAIAVINKIGFDIKNGNNIDVDKTIK